MEARSRGQRAGLSRDAVLAAARDLRAERGVEGLSMRAVAARLGVAPNALYSHVGGKTDLVDALLDDVLAAVRVPGPEADPVAGLRAVVLSTYEVLLEHPDLVPLYLARQGARGPNARALGDVMTGLLDRAGVRGTAARDAVRVLVVHAIGLAAVGGGPEDGLTAQDLRATFLTGLGWLLAGITGRPSAWRTSPSGPGVVVNRRPPGSEHTP